MEITDFIRILESWSWPILISNNSQFRFSDLYSHLTNFKTINWAKVISILLQTVQNLSLHKQIQPSCCFKQDSSNSSSALDIPHLVSKQSSIKTYNKILSNHHTGHDSVVLFHKQHVLNSEERKLNTLKRSITKGGDFLVAFNTFLEAISNND